MKGIYEPPDMIKAIQEGRKTVTRGVIKIKGVDIHDKKWVEAKYNQKYNCCFINDGIRETWSAIPRYQVGEVVYIKEALCLGHDVPFYKADGNCTPYNGKWKSPLFMPAWAARYFIKITDVRAERLQEITEEDAIAEGVPGIATHKPYPRQFRDSFEALWDSINKDYQWESNPFVWVYSFGFYLHLVGRR